MAKQSHSLLTFYGPCIVICWLSTGQKIAHFLRNPLRAKRRLLHLETSPYRAVTLVISGTKTSLLMLYRKIIAVCSQIHTKHINTQRGQNVELLNVKLAVHIVTTGLYRVIYI
jgi:hypothetical protein